MKEMAAAVASASRIKTNENIQVYLRVRPLSEREKSYRFQDAVKVTSNREVVVKQDNRTSKKFTFDRSFGPETSQVDVYQSVVAPLIEEVLAGYNCTVFAYGQTGTGKTHTMIGEECSNVGNEWDGHSQIGIIPRAVNHLFEELRILGVEFSMRISFLELYNEELSDLLSASECPIRIYDDNSKKGSVIVHGLEELPVHSSSDVYKLLAKGQEKRKTASTLMNVQSSRSHTIFSILVHIREQNADGEEVLKVGKLNLVDLAGSENINKAGNEKGIRTRESANINQSLLTLGRVITALVERTPHIPYRESKLTRLLQESLGGRTKTSIIATVSPSDLEETLSTLEYAHRAKNILNKPEINQKLTKKLALKEYSEEIDRLKRDLMACRSKNGIYLAEETYADMMCRLDAQNKELSEKQSSIKVFKDEMTKIQSVFNEISLSLAQKEAELAKTYDSLHSTKAELGQTVNVLQRTNKKYHEKKEILANHVRTEEVLSSQAKELQNAAITLSTDAHLLHDTLERRKIIDRDIVSVCDSFEKSMHNNVNEMSCDIDDFNKLIENEIYNVVGHIDTSTSRNTEFSAVVFEKLFTQRQLCEINTANLKKLLDEKMTQELRLTDEQTTLIESVISQSIISRREFNEGLLNDLLQPLLIALNEQNEKILGRESLILKLLSANRESVRNFCSLQTTKLQKLSLDTTNFIETSRIALEIGVTKNIGIAEKMNELLEEWKINNENMKAIAPNLLQSVESLDSATKNQIEETDNINMDNEKRSNELNNELKIIGSVVKEHSETNRNEISKMIESVNNHSKVFVASLNSSKNKILEQFELNKSLALSTLQNIESKVVGSFQTILSSSSEIGKDIEIQDAHLKEDSQNNLDVNTKLKAVVTRFNTSSKKKLDEWRNVLNNFHKNELKIYQPTGDTPAKREYNYPRTLAATSPHYQIIRKFWSTHKETDLDVSSSVVEENETTNDSQSPSIPQHFNALITDNEIQSPSMEESLLALQEPISNRVLTEVSDPVSNSAMSTIKIAPLQKVSSEISASSDRFFNSNYCESNKENF